MATTIDMISCPHYLSTGAIRWCRARVKSRPRSWYTSPLIVVERVEGSRGCNDTTFFLLGNAASATLRIASKSFDNSSIRKCKLEQPQGGFEQKLRTSTNSFHARGLRTFDTMGPLITAAPCPPAPGTPALALTHPKLMHATPRWTTGERRLRSGKAGLTRRATSSGCPCQKSCFLIGKRTWPATRAEEWV